MVVLLLACGTAPEPAAEPAAPPVVPAACVEGAPEGTVFVQAPGDAATATGAAGDGSAGAPVGTVAEALTRVAPGGTIRIASGTYAGGLLLVDPIAHAGLTMEGCGDTPPLIEGQVVVGGTSGAALRGVTLRGLDFDLSLWLVISHAQELVLDGIGVEGASGTWVFVDEAAVRFKGASRFVADPDYPDPLAGLGISGSTTTVELDPGASLVIDGSAIGVVVDDGTLVVADAGVLDVSAREYGLFLTGAAVLYTDPEARVDLSDVDAGDDGFLVVLGEDAAMEVTCAMTATGERGGALAITDQGRFMVAAGGGFSATGFDNGDYASIQVNERGVLGVDGELTLVGPGGNLGLGAFDAAEIAVSGVLELSGGALGLYTDDDSRLEVDGAVRVAGATSIGVRLGGGDAVVSGLEVVDTTGVAVWVGAPGVVLRDLEVHDVSPGSGSAGDGLVFSPDAGEVDLAGFVVDGAAGTAVRVVGVGGTVAEGTVTGSGFALIQEACAGAVLEVSSFAASGNGDDTPHLCDGVEAPLR